MVHSSMALVTRGVWWGWGGQGSAFDRARKKRRPGYGRAGPAGPRAAPAPPLTRRGSARQGLKFAMREGGKTVGAGVVSEVIKE